VEGESSRETLVGRERDRKRRTGETVPHSRSAWRRQRTWWGTRREKKKGGLSSWPEEELRPGPGLEAREHLKRANREVTLVQEVYPGKTILPKKKEERKAKGRRPPKDCSMELMPGQRRCHHGRKA